MRARKAKEDSARGFFYSIEIGSDAFALGKAFARNLLFVCEQTCCATHVNENISAFNALHCARDNLTFFASEFSENRNFFCFANLLHDHLLGSLRCNTTVVTLRLD